MTPSDFRRAPLLVFFALLPLIFAHQGFGYSYSDPGGHFIDVKFGIGAPNSLPFEPKKLFKPSYVKEVPVFSDGQLREFYKFLKEASEEDARESGNATQLDAERATSEAYVSVKMGTSSYNYRY